MLLQVLWPTQISLPSSTFSSQLVGASQGNVPFFDYFGVRCRFAGQQLRLCDSNIPRPLNYHGTSSTRYHGTRSDLYQVTVVWLITIFVDRGTQIGANPCGLMRGGSTFFTLASLMTVMFRSVSTRAN